MAAELSLREIGQIALPVKNLERAVEFYRDKLGLKFLFQAPPGLAFFECGATRLMLSIPEKGFEKHASTLYFRVPNIDRAFTILKERGVPFDDAPHVIHKQEGYELKMAFFRDPDSNIHAIMSETGHL